MLRDYLAHRKFWVLPTINLGHCGLLSELCIFWAFNFLIMKIWVAHKWLPNPRPVSQSPYWKVGWVGVWAVTSVTLLQSVLINMYGNYYRLLSAVSLLACKLPEGWDHILVITVFAHRYSFVMNCKLPLWSPTRVIIFNHLFIEHVLGAKHESRHWDITVDRRSPCSHEACVLMKENSNKQISTHVTCQLSLMTLKSVYLVYTCYKV